MNANEIAIDALMSMTASITQIMEREGKAEELIPVLRHTMTVVEGVWGGR
jgi:hypothetical protein